MTRRRLGGLFAGLLLACGGGPPPLTSRVDGIVRPRKRALENGVLMIASEALDDALLLAVLDDPRVPALTGLELFDNALTAAGVHTLLTHAKTARPRTIHLGSNPVGDDGLVALAASERLATVEHLEVGSTGATSTGIAALARSPHLTSPRLVQVGFEPLGDDAATALAALRTGTLLAKKAGFTGVGARALIAGTAAKVLALDENPIGRGGLVGLPALAPTLTSLSLKQTGLGPADAAALAALPAPALRHLTLSHAPLGDDGVTAILRAPWFAALESLDLTGTGAAARTFDAVRAVWGSKRGLSAG